MSLFEAQAHRQFKMERINDRRSEVAQLQLLKERGEFNDRSQRPSRLVQRPLMLLMQVMQR